MSLEFLDLIQWAVIIIVGGLVHLPLGNRLAAAADLNPVFACVLVYLAVAGAIKSVCLLIKRLMGEKVLGTDAFGRLEYYLGMVAGGVRFFCILLFGLAIFNAPQYTDQELARKLDVQNDDLGAIYFPPLGSVQRSVFQYSCFGRIIHENLSGQLIQVAVRPGDLRRDTVWRQREREVNDIIAPRR